MPLTSDNDKPRSTLWACLIGLGLLGLAGCVPESAGYEVDPMTGGPSIPQNKAVPPPAGVSVAVNTLPPLPAAQGSVSPAANASGATQSLNPASADPSLDLRHYRHRQADEQRHLEAGTGFRDRCSGVVS